MTAVDTLVAIVREEPEARSFAGVLSRQQVLVGTPTLLEASMVMPSIVTEEVVDRALRRFLAEPWTRRVAFSVEMFDAAHVAFRRYGRGRGHPAKLNFGDCMSYAVAKVHGIPLLYKGEDFSQTDIVSALA